MAFEISGAVIAEGLVDAALADTALEVMPLAMDSLLSSTFADSAFALPELLGGETLTSVFGSEAVPGVLQQAITPAAQGVVEGGVGAGEGITANTPGALQTGAAPYPEAPVGPQMQPVNATNTFNPEVRPGMQLTDTGWQPTGEGVQPSGIEQVKATPGQPGVLNADGTVTAPDGSKMSWEDYSKVQGFDPSTTPPSSGNDFMKGFSEFADKHPFLTGAGIYGIASATGMLNQKPQTFGPQPSGSFYSPYKFSPNFQGSHPNANVYKPSYAGYVGSSYAGGGITQVPPTPGLMDGGASGNVNFMGKDMYPMSQQDNSHYATPSQMPTSAQQTLASYEPATNPLTGEATAHMASGGIAGYAQGGSLLQQLIDGALASGQMPTQEQYLAAQGLHTSFNPDYAFDKEHAKFVPMSSITPIEQAIPQPAAAASTDSGGGGAKAGGIVGYYRGSLATSTGGSGDVYGATSRFLDMYDPASRYTAPSDASRPDVGIFSDSNPSTRDKSALDAAAIRQNAIAKRAQVNTRTNYAKPSVGIGRINVQPQPDKDSDSDSVLAASGGIMGYNLGGYAAGGNPRLLRGPGDGMSDDIPATIGGRQPARLADGEFVVPADVVSGLGNGSTEAGAKVLHKMMDKVRMDRTGKKKQAPAIKAGKYVPK